MPTHVALLRGINVGGRNKVAMADLRAVVSSLGHTDVATYIQSGNVVFTAAGAGGSAGGASEAGGSEALAAGLERAIAAALGVSPRVVVRSRAELAQVVRDNPYHDEPDPKAVHAVLHATDPAPEFAGAVAGAQRQATELGSRDTAQLVGRTLFLHTPDGFGRSKLAELLAARTRRLDTTGTARNWATVTKLLAMLDT